MHIAAIRPFVTTGIAIVGAGVIAVTPLAPSPADIKIANPAVQLTAAPDPITAYTQLFQNTSASVSAIINTLVTDPDPIGQAITALLGSINPADVITELLDFNLPQVIANFQQIDFQQIIQNQTNNLTALGNAFQTFLQGITAAFSPGGGLAAQFQLATNQLLAGQVYDAVSTVVNGLVQDILFGTFDPNASVLPVLFDVITIVQTGVHDTATVINALDLPFLNQLFAPVVAVADQALPISALGLGIALISPPAALAFGFGDAAQAVVDAVTAGNPTDLFNALVSGPATILDAFLNGRTQEGVGGLIGGSGGAIPILLSIRDSIADAITSVIPPAATALTPATTLGTTLAAATAPATSSAAANTVPSLAANKVNITTGPAVPTQSTDGPNAPAPATGALPSQASDTARDVTNAVQTHTPGPGFGKAVSDAAKASPSGTSAPNGATDLSKGNKATSASNGSNSGERASDAKRGGDGQGASAQKFGDAAKKLGVGKSSAGSGAGK